MAEAPKTIGRYEVLGVAGRGAMGVVYKARDPLINRVVAIKVVALSPAFGEAEREEFKARFFREAQAAGGLHHPGIVTIFDVGDAGGVPFMAQEFVEGESLSRRLKAGGPVPFVEAARLVRQVADALAYAHGQGVVHRDIKPDNILVTPAGRVVLTDFGIARMAASELTRTGEVLGTPHYMSPEQILGQPVDGRSDLFSLGVVFFQLLAGQRPFEGETITSVCYQIVHAEPKTLPGDLGLPPEALPLLAKFLAKAKEDRFATGAEAVGAIDAALAAAAGTAAGTFGAAPPAEKPVPAADPSGTRPAAAPAPAPPASEPSAPRAKPAASPAKAPSPPSPSSKAGGTARTSPPSTPATARGEGKSVWLVLGLGLAAIVVVGFLSFLVVAKVAHLLGSRQPAAPAEAGQTETPAGAAPAVVPETPADSAQPPGREPAAPTVKPSATPPQGVNPRGSAGKGAAPSPDVSTARPAPAGEPPGEEPQPVPAPKEKKAHVGVIAEGPLQRGNFKVFVDGELKVDQPCMGLGDAGGRKKGFRLVNHVMVPAGRHDLRFVLAAPPPRGFEAEVTYPVDLPPGGDLILKVEPRRMPARLMVKEIPTGGAPERP